ncbi:MAG: hypothetical protein OWU84_11230 [Firmicutes bacterium]|nr:hypothetical protein [Bacillota bacterium]
MEWNQVVDLFASELGQVSRAALRKEAEALSRHYREESPWHPSTLAMGLAYVLTRMPATYHALLAVFSEVAARVPTPPRSLLDVGAGPGTALLAISEVFPRLQDATALEPNDVMRALGERLTRSCPWPVRWHRESLHPSLQLPPSDWVVASYLLGELPPAFRGQAVKTLWQRTEQVLILVEPGTSRGFDRIRQARDLLLAEGGHMVAPCPHAASCPIVPPDWCHFSVRVPRTREHKQLKNATAPYEDEKFAYLAMSRAPVPLAPSRIIRHPWRQPGDIRLTLCTPHGLTIAEVTRRDKALFRQARKAEWGDAWPMSEP